MSPLAIARMMGALAGPAVHLPGRWDAATQIALAGLLRPHTDEPPVDPRWPFPFPRPSDWIGHSHWGPLPDPWVIAALGRDLQFLNPQPLPPIDGLTRIHILAGMLGWLNPQPLPPGPPERWRVPLVAGIADAVIMQALVASEAEGAALVGHFVDDLSGPGFLWPWSKPRPNWLDAAVTAADLFVVAGRLDGSAEATSHNGLAQELSAAAERLAEQAFRRPA